MSSRCVMALCIVLAAVNSARSTLIKDLNHVQIHVNDVHQHTKYTVMRDGKVLQKVAVNHAFGEDARTTNIENGFEIHGNGQTIRFESLSNGTEFTLLRVSRNASSREIASDYVDLNIGRVAWYGGPSYFRRYWPIEKMTLTNYSMVTKTEEASAIAERYWLNSNGVFIYVDPITPLFVHQNGPNNNKLILSAENAPPYNVRQEQFSLIYYIGSHINTRLVHLEAVNRFLGKPTGLVDQRMVRHPIWSTWARYKKNIDEQLVEKFAHEILANQFENSQLEIDDDWEQCYGSLSFNQTKFPNITAVLERLKRLGFRITLWVHPFINKNCEPWYSIAKEQGYFVADHKNNTDTEWWNGKAAHIDFTKSDAAEWYRRRLVRLQEKIGIDSFKFDAGENDFAPKDPVLNSSINLHPGALATAYLNFVSQFGSFIEVRAGQNTQHLPIFVRMMDKDTIWTVNNGLASLIPTLLQFNMVGYPFVLPDMIGGNGYNHKPSKELFIRWLQANVFMPSLQFSYVPWDYDNETIEISRYFTYLHKKISGVIVDRMNTTVHTGEPVNLPIWWFDPEDTVAQQINDEFLLGSTFLVAPVIEEGAVTRDIYLPKGIWLNEKNAKYVKGPIWLMDYAAPLDVLPYFRRYESHSGHTNQRYGKYDSLKGINNRI